MRVSTTLVGIVGAFDETTQLDFAPAPFAFVAINAHALEAVTALTIEVGSACVLKIFAYAPPLVHASKLF